jgi:hypothetical protein
VVRTYGLHIKSIVAEEVARHKQGWTNGAYYSLQTNPLQEFVVAIEMRNFQAQLLKVGT